MTKEKATRSNRQPNYGNKTHRWIRLEKNTMNNTIIATVMVTAIALTTVITAYADDNIYIKTGKGNFVYNSDQVKEAQCSSFDVKGVRYGEVHTIVNNFYPADQPKHEWINGVSMKSHTSTCENNKIDYSDTKWDFDVEKIIDYLKAGGEITSHQENLECLCEYWNANTVKDEYTYIITDMPNNRETPANYQNIVKAGVKAGLDQWGDINNIRFT